MNHEIRPMTGADKPPVMEILRATPEFTPLEVSVAEEVLDAYLEDTAGSGYCALVGVADSGVAGYAVYGQTPLTTGTWDLYWIAVDRRMQGTGLGKALLRHTEESVRRAGGRMLLVETSGKPGYEKTLAFYRSMGYPEICRIADFYAPGDDKLVFQKVFK